MSRTKGALGKKTILKLKRLKLYKQTKQDKKRGRPKNPVPPPPEPTPVFPMYKAKFLGHCPKCQAIIGKRDLVSRFVFECPSCGKKMRTRILKQHLKQSAKSQSKKDFLENIIAHEHIDTVGLNDAEISPKHLKVRDV